MMNGKHTARIRSGNCIGTSFMQHIILAYVAGASAANEGEFSWALNCQCNRYSRRKTAQN
jgi:hypothetical protein